MGKRELLFIKTSFLLLFIIMAMNISQAQENPIEKHRWKQRVVLVFSPQDQPEAGQSLIADLQPGSPAWDERKLVLYDIQGEGGMGPSDYLTKMQVRILRKGFAISLGEAAVVLVGLDGGQKLKSFEPVTKEKLYGLIDSMPMRQAEMDGQKPHDP